MTKIDETEKEFDEFKGNIIKISALNSTGLEKLQEKITEMFNLNKINIDNENIITNLRHKNLISKAIENIEKTENSLKDKMPLDIISICIKDILENLGKITGEFITDEIINEIFSKFCLGK